MPYQCPKCSGYTPGENVGGILGSEPHSWQGVEVCIIVSEWSLPAGKLGKISMKNTTIQIDILRCTGCGCEGQPDFFWVDEISEECEADDVNEKYERLARQFYNETGLMAPGKDVGAGSGQPDFDVRTKKWDKWMKNRSA